MSTATRRPESPDAAAARPVDLRRRVRPRPRTVPTSILDEAETLFREAIAASSETLSPDHRETLALMANLAAVLVDLGKLEEGRDIHRHVYESFRERLGERHRYTALTLHNLAGANARLDLLDEADRQYREVQQILGETLPAGHPELAMNLEAWLEVVEQLGDDDRAADLDTRLRRIRASSP